MSTTTSIVVTAVGAGALQIEVLFHPLERLSGLLAGATLGTALPYPEQVDIVSTATDPVVHLVGAAEHILHLTVGGRIWPVICESSSRTDEIHC